MHYVFIYPQIKRLTGAQRLILALAAALQKQGEQLTLLTHYFAPECRAALHPDINLIETKTNLNLSGNHYFDSLIEYLATPTLLKQLPPDTDAICFFGPPSLPGLWWAKKIRGSKLRLLYFCYEPPRAAYTDRLEVTKRMGKFGFMMQGLLWLYRPIDKYLTSQADAVLVNGQYGQKIIWETYHLPSTIITHGAELNLNSAEQSVALKAKLALNGRNIILTVNHLHPRKRVDLLIQTLPLILAEHPQTSLVIVGKGPEEATLRALTQELKLTAQQIIFAGFVSDDELASYYQIADIYAHSGRAESFGLSILEACTAGKPVVAVGEGGPLEIIIEGETGFLVEANPPAFAAKINLLLAQPEVRQSMGKAAMARALSHYTWEQGAQDFKHIG